MEPRDLNQRVQIPSVPEAGPLRTWLTWLGIIGLVYLLLLAVGMIGSGFKAATGGHARELFEFASNPLMGLMIGTVATALIQSSSTVTSIIVGMVAGGLPVTVAVPMVMGANIGTTITNTLVSLGHVRSRTEFRRAFSAATVHDFFNLLAVVLFLPLEIMFGLLEKTGGFLAGLLVGGASIDVKQVNFIKPITKPVINEVRDMLSFLGSEAAGAGLVLIGILLIFVAITVVGKLLRSVMVGRAKHMFHTTIGRGPVSGIASGATVTVLVQSSSTTTSLVVPLVGSGIFRVRDIYPFTLGANIGTCVTALLAATAVSGPTAVFALQIALVHLVYNASAVIVIYGIPILREIPPRLAENLAELASRNKLYVLAYLGAVYFVTPLLLVYADTPTLLVAAVCAALAVFGIRSGWFAEQASADVDEEPARLEAAEMDRRCEALMCRLPPHYLSAGLQGMVLQAWQQALDELREADPVDAGGEHARKQQIVRDWLQAGPDHRQAEAQPILSDEEGELARDVLTLGRALLLELVRSDRLGTESADAFLEELNDLRVETYLEVIESDANHALTIGDHEAAAEQYRDAISRLQDAHEGDRFQDLIHGYREKIRSLRRQAPDTAGAA